MNFPIASHRFSLPSVQPLGPVSMTIQGKPKGVPVTELIISLGNGISTFMPVSAVAGMVPLISKSSSPKVKYCEQAETNS